MRQRIIRCLVALEESEAYLRPLLPRPPPPPAREAGAAAMEMEERTVEQREAEAEAAESYTASTFSPMRTCETFQRQIERLRSKLQAIAGVEAVRDYDRSREEARARSAAVAARQVAALRAASGGGSGGGVLGVGRLSNEELAHELLLDPAFQLRGEDGNGPYTSSVAEAMSSTTIRLLQSASL
jgi:hypothetical protein